MRVHPDCAAIGHCGDRVFSGFLPTEEEILQPDAGARAHRKVTQKLVGWTMPGVGNDVAGEKNGPPGYYTCFSSFATDIAAPSSFGLGPAWELDWSNAFALNCSLLWIYALLPWFPFPIEAASTHKRVFGGRNSPCCFVQR